MSGESNSRPPLGAVHDDQRNCARLLRMEGDREVLCGKPATVHIIYHWDEQTLPDPAGYNHGWACPEHWQEYRERWSCAGHHAVGAHCGMPGSRVTLDGCFFDDLPTAEPVRAVATQEVPA